MSGEKSIHSLEQIKAVRANLKLVINDDTQDLSTRLCALLTRVIATLIFNKKMTEEDVAGICKIRASEVGILINGHVAYFTLDELWNIARSLGFDTTRINFITHFPTLVESEN